VGLKPVLGRHTPRRRQLQYQPPSHTGATPRAIASPPPFEKKRERKKREGWLLWGGTTKTMSFSPVEHDVGLGPVDGVVHPSPRLLHAESAPFSLFTEGGRDGRR
jgi:hypothetical protein